VSADGEEITRIRNAGEFFGFPGPYADARITSVGESVVEKYGGDDLDIIIRDYPEKARQIMQTLIERVSNAKKVK
jgi:hypothetical protein